MNYKEYLFQRLKCYKKEDIVFTEHAMEQAIFREMSIEEIKENIINPIRLIYAGKQQAENVSEEKFDCYFAYTDIYCHRYILVLTGNCIVCTVIKINRRWQYLFQENAKL